MVICLERGADLLMAQLILLPLTVSCFSKIQIGFTFLVPAYLGSPGKGRYYVVVYSHQEMQIESTNISISSADSKGQLRTPSLTNNNSSKSNTEALCCVEMCELQLCCLFIII